MRLLKSKLASKIDEVGPSSIEQIIVFVAAYRFSFKRSLRTGKGRRVRNFRIIVLTSKSAIPRPFDHLKRGRVRDKNMVVGLPVRLGKACN